MIFCKLYNFEYFVHCVECYKNVEFISILVKEYDFIRYIILISKYDTEEAFEVINRR
jgi:hypothetical protein